jgi:TnpA family transposase
MLPEMLRVALSIGAGRIKPSTILWRVATYSRKSELHFAFRELGHAVRTSLLEYLSDVELRRLIQVRNKQKRIASIISFSGSPSRGGVLAVEGMRDEQRNFIKYNIS